MLATRTFGAGPLMSMGATFIRACTFRVTIEVCLNGRPYASLSPSLPILLCVRYQYGPGERALRSLAVWIVLLAYLVGLFASHAMPFFPSPIFTSAVHLAPFLQCGLP